MPSDEPLPDRCGARVTDKVGLELSFEETIVTDRVIEAVRLVDAESGAVIVGEPTYEAIRQYLWDDHEVTAIAVDVDDIALDVPTVPAVGPDIRAGSPPRDDGLTWVDVSDAVNGVTNARKDFQGYCERYPMDDDPNDRCYVHQGGGAPEGNVNGMKHGLYAQRTNFYEALPDADKRFVEAMVDSWLEMAPYNRDNVGMVNELYRVAIDQVRAWLGIDEYVEDGEVVGLTTEQYERDEEGNLREVVDEHPANMPYSRLDGDIRAKLKEHGIYQSPDQQQADATESLAKKLSGLGDD